MKRRWFLPLALVVGGACLVLAAGPELKIPSEVKPAGDYATFTPGGDAKSITYVGLSGVDPFPAGLLKDGTTFVLPTRGLKDGEYRFAAVGAGSTGEQTRVDFVVTVGSKQMPPSPIPPTPGPGPTPGSLFFVVVRADGPASPEFTRVMSDSAWDALRMAGHTVKDYGYQECCRVTGICLPAGTALPAVVTLRVNADKKTSRIVRAAIPLPTTVQGIAALPQGVSP